MRIEFKSIVLNILSVLSAKGIILVLGFLNSVIVARSLGIVGQGQYAVAVTIYTTIFQVVNMGLHSAHTYYLSKDREKLPVVIGNSMIVSGIAGILSFIVIVMLAFIGKGNGEIKKYYMLALAVVPAYLFFYLQEQTFLVLDKIKWMNLFDIFVVIIPLLGNIYGAWLGKISVNYVLALIAITYYILDIIGIIYLLKISKTIKASWEFYKECMEIGIWAALACFLGFLVLRIDIFMVKRMTDDINTGLYSLAVNLTDIFNSFSATCVLVVFPKVNAVKDEFSRYNIYKEITRKMFMCMVLITIILEVVIGYLLPLVYGEEYQLSVQTFRILIIGVVLWGMARIPISYYTTNKNYKMGIAAYVIALIMDIVFNAILIPYYGINGAAIASVISYAFVCIYCIVAFKLAERRLVR